MPAATSSTAVAPNGGMKAENSKSAVLSIQRLFLPLHRHIIIFYTLAAAAYHNSCYLDYHDEADKGNEKRSYRS